MHGQEHPGLNFQNPEKEPQILWKQSTFEHPNYILGCILRQGEMHEPSNLTTSCLCVPANAEVLILTAPNSELH